jgi:hypothetical protein
MEVLHEVREHEQWTTNYLVDRLKQHLATFEVSVTSNDDRKVYDNRKYYQQAHESLLFGVLKPTPPFVICLSDLSSKIIKELYYLDGESRKYVLKQAVGRIFEDINSELYHNSISKVLEVRFKDE